MYPAIHLTESVSLPTYILVISLVYCLALFWVVKRASHLGADRTLTLDIGLTIMMGGFVGARLFHIVYEAPTFYMENPLEMLKFWNGGFVFYGGAIGAFISSVTMIKLRGQDWRPWADFYAPVGAFGYALGRFACLLNGCCFGSHCELPWSLSGRHPTPIYASLWEFGVLSLLLVLESRRDHLRPKGLRQPGAMFLLWIGLHSIGRIVMEIFRADDRGAHPLGMSIATWISIGLVLTAVIGLLRTSHTARSKN